MDVATILKNVSKLRKYQVHQVVMVINGTFHQNLVGEIVEVDFDFGDNCWYYMVEFGSEIEKDASYFREDQITLATNMAKSL